VEGIVGQNGNFKSNVNVNLEIYLEQNDFLDYQESSTTLKKCFHQTTHQQLILNDSVFKMLKHTFTIFQKKL
jgi:hypothetical protein